MPTKMFYSVARDVKAVIYTQWSACEKNIHKFPHAVFKGFQNIEQVVVFLIASQSYINCEVIPVFDDTANIKNPKYYGHKCSGNQCSEESIDTSIIDTDADIMGNEPLEVQPNITVVPYTSGKISSTRLIFLLFWQCV